MIPSRLKWEIRVKIDTDIETRRRWVVEKAIGEKPLQNLRTVFGRRKPPIFVTSSIVLLLLAEKPMHGYALFKEMCEMGVYGDTVET